MKKQISAITSMVADIYNYIAKKPDCEASDLLEELKISRRTFYSCLMGLQDEQIIWRHKGTFLLCHLAVAIIIIKKVKNGGNYATSSKESK